jgi:hypothetical protein
MNEPPYPARCRARPRFGGLVAPWISFQHGGHVAFGVFDPARRDRVLSHGLCQICGQPLEERVCLVVRPMDVRAGYVAEPALHPECLAYSRKQCPMLVPRQFANSEALVQRNPRVEARSGRSGTSGSRTLGNSPVAVAQPRPPTMLTLRKPPARPPNGSGASLGCPGSRWPATAHSTTRSARCATRGTHHQDEGIDMKDDEYSVHLRVIVRGEGKSL